MFRVKHSDGRPLGQLATGAVLCAVTLALLFSCGSLLLILREYHLLGACAAASQSVPMAEIESLRDEVLLQVMCAVVVSVALLASAVALVWFRQRYSASQQTLRDVKTLAHNILASMDQGVITLDQHHTITSINSAASRFLGVAFDCVGQPLSAVCTASLPLEGLARQLAERRSPIRDHDFAVTRDNRSQRYRADAHFLHDVEGQPLGCVFLLRDVTERLLLEERMARMERFISLGTLASGLHHELKNPLTALSLHIQLLEERLGHLGAAEPVGDLTSVLKTEVYRLNGVLESFRSFASLQRLNLQTVDAVDVLEEAVRLVQPQATSQGVQILISRPDTGLPHVSLDTQKFQQAVLNVLINALEAMPTGGSVTLHAFLENQQLLVEVADTGTGIPPEIRPNLFKPYFSTKCQGTGMGLALTEKLIGQHAGHIDYVTGKQGTTFRITLPLAPPRDEV